MSSGQLKAKFDGVQGFKLHQRTDGHLFWKVQANFFYCHKIWTEQDKTKQDRTGQNRTGQAEGCSLIAVAASKVGNPPVVVVPEVARTAAAHVAHIGGVLGLKVPGGTQSQSGGYYTLTAF